MEIYKTTYHGVEYHSDKEQLETYAKFISEYGGSYTYCVKPLKELDIKELQ